MQPLTRRSVIAASVAIFTMAGCTSDALDTPDHDQTVSLQNEGTEKRTVRVWVVREKTSETVYDQTHEVPVGADMEVYNLKQADPNGVESFSICGEVIDASTTQSTTTADTQSTQSPFRRCTTIKTNECHALSGIIIDDDGLSVLHAIC